MGRSRSRSVSPVRNRPERRRSKDRERNRDRDRDRDRRRRRSRERRRSPHDRHRHRSRSRSRSRSKERSHEKDGKKLNQSRLKDRPAVSELELQGKTEDEKEMMRVMGFGSFDTTKGKKVDGNESGDVHVILKRKYRQYMNRKGGFNRPLDFVA